MDIYVARQPIFNRKMGLYGYELLYRRSEKNYFEGGDQSGATKELVYNTFLVIGLNKLTDGTVGFINFTQDLLEMEVARILPKDQVVIEILETVQASDKVVAACKKLKELGYTIALDDFVFDRSGQDYTALIELADIIKIEFSIADKQAQRELLRRYKNKITFLAEKVETREEYKEAVEMGYELFQGYFFSKPMMVKSKEIGTLNVHLIHIMQELYKENPNFSVIADIIQKDLGLSFKLLKMANSIYFGGKYTIKSLTHAVVRLGTVEMKHWVSIMLLREHENEENSELIKMCLLRGKVLELISGELKQNHSETEFFLTGILSSIDVIVGERMEKILNSLPLSLGVKDSLLGKPEHLRDCLDCVLAYERFEFDDAQAGLAKLDLSLERYMELYVEGLTWLRTTSG
ncbi:HDOD domain-containing protein [Anoxybacterium hadale]|uniref:HDOD domain-containing protein n=1 Tax=Anoxybacterium hadale TaxID=3408580 RepID=A0ACD1AEW2_9FIRM|nr:HDOD domain-containing protein [Clostridiales bacterium]